MKAKKYSDSDSHGLKLWQLCLIVGAVSLVLGSTTYGIITWSQHQVWTWESQNPNFTVDGEVGTIDLGVVIEDYNNTLSKNYTVTNVGNVPITVVASASGENVTADWSLTMIDLNVGESQIFVLNYTVHGPGYLDVLFSLA